MLVFKSNIYEKHGDLFPIVPPISVDPSAFDPYEFIKTGLAEESAVLRIIGDQPRQFWAQDAQHFYPNAGKSGSPGIFGELLRIIGTGLEDRNAWHVMNTYHFCFLYDILRRHAYNYNHDSPDEQKKILAHLQGQPIDFDRFVRDYFFNTVFLLDADDYNALTAKEKEERGYNCPCQFGVVNGLLPTREEMQLQTTRDYPYSIYV